MSECWARYVQIVELVDNCIMINKGVTVCQIILIQTEKQQLD